MALGHSENDYRLKTILNQLIIANSLFAIINRVLEHFKILKTHCALFNIQFSRTVEFHELSIFEQNRMTHTYYDCTSTPDVDHDRSFGNFDR